MKHLKALNTLIYSLSAFVLVVTSLSCTDKEENSEIKNQITKEQIDEVLAEMKTIGEKTGQIVSINLSDIMKENYQNYFDIIDNSEKVITFATGGDSSKSPKDNYIVTCVWGDGSSKVSKCGTSVSCAGAATWDCLENGGCATVCNAFVEYIPTKFMKEDPRHVEQLNSIFDQATKLSNKNNDIFAFSISVDKEKKNLQINKFAEIESPLVFSNQFKSKSEPNKAIRVICSDGNGTTYFDQTFSTQIDASRAIIDCTDNFGGCAEVCNIVAFVAYLPLLEKLTPKDLEEIYPLIF